MAKVRSPLSDVFSRASKPSQPCPHAHYRCCSRMHVRKMEVQTDPWVADGAIIRVTRCVQIAFRIHKTVYWSVKAPHQFAPERTAHRMSTIALKQYPLCCPLARSIPTVKREPPSCIVLQGKETLYAHKNIPSESQLSSLKLQRLTEGLWWAAPPCQLHTLQKSAPPPSQPPLPARNKLFVKVRKKQIERPQ
jgi:hypothetical protein